MSPVDNIQTLFVIFVLVCLFGLVGNALLTGSVWVRGARTGFVNFKELAHKRDRKAHPSYYWGFLTFYSVAFFGLLYIGFLADGKPPV